MSLAYFYQNQQEELFIESQSDGDDWKRAEIQSMDEFNRTEGLYNDYVGTFLCWLSTAEAANYSAHVEAYDYNLKYSCDLPF
tara:strand:- start:974 stop:1219 length:246 start_codon:yes stop_codon:yes gene_type:complete